MSRYETYKPSGIDWIGDVPKHWEVKRLKNIVLNDIGGLWGDEPADDENDIIVLRVADFDRTNSRIIDNPDFTYRNIKASQLDGRLIKQGDILLEKSGGGEQQPVGKAVLFDKDFRAVTSNFINKIETIPSVNNYFALYLFDALYYNNINVRNIKQTTGIQNLDNTGFFAEKISLPPTTEQLTIAKYLDEQTQKIDRLIANKKAQAEKLKELRQIEINNAVTKGLNPNAEMKDSGIEWLGKIPKAWSEKRLKNLVSPKITDGPHETPELVDDLDGIPFISAEAITENGINYEARGGNISAEQDRIYSLKCKPKRDDIFMVKSGSTTGRIGYVDTDLNFNIWSPLALIRANSNTYSRFLYFALCSNYIQKQVQLTWSFGTQPNIGMGVIERLRLVIPPKDEQIVIASYLIQRTTAIDQLIKNIEAQIEKLQELRKIKIYEAVTGKIKVNAYAETTA